MADQIPDRGTPDPKVTSPEAAPAANSSSLQQPDLATSVSKAQSPAEIRAVIAQNRAAMEKSVDNARKGKVEDAGKPVANTAPDLAAAVAAEETPAPEAEEKPDGAEPTAEETAEGAAPEGNEGDEADGDDDGGDGPISPITGKRTHLRLPADDKVGRLAASYMKRNKDMPMETALEKARNQLGIKPKEEAAPAAETPAVSDLPATVEETEAKIKELRAERKKANTELNFEVASDLSDKLEDLLQHRFTLEREGEKKVQAEKSAYDQRFAASNARAGDLYAFVGDAQSVGYKRMIEIESDLKDAEDPLYYSPDKPLKLAQMVAAELSIAPRRKGAPATPTAKVAAPANGTPTTKKQVLPGGSSRTTPPPVNQPPAIDSKIQSVKSINDLRNLRKELKLQT